MHHLEINPFNPDIIPLDKFVPAESLPSKSKKRAEEVADFLQKRMDHSATKNFEVVSEILNVKKSRPLFGGKAVTEDCNIIIETLSQHKTEKTDRRKGKE